MDGCAQKSTPHTPFLSLQFKRKSTSGISYSLFALVMLGNTLYGVSVLLKNPDPGQSEASYIVHHLPWLIGSLGVLSLDILVSFEFSLWKDRRREEASLLAARPLEEGPSCQVEDPHSVSSASSRTLGRRLTGKAVHDSVILRLPLPLRADKVGPAGRAGLEGGVGHLPVPAKAILQGGD